MAPHAEVLREDGICVTERQRTRKKHNREARKPAHTRILAPDGHR